MWEELLKEVAVIKWSLICMAISMWGVSLYFLLKAIPKWWKSFEEKKKGPIGFRPTEKD